MHPPSIVSVASAVSETQAALNIAWTLLCGFMVMLMQAGFALLETGLARRKNVAHTMAMNFLVYSIGVLGFWSVGFALQMGGLDALPTLGAAHVPLGRELTVTLFGREHGLFGLSGFMLSPSVCTDAVATIFLFQMMFMDTACTIPTGALAERWRLTSFVLFSFVVSTVIYPVYANWVWGGGFLSQLGLSFGLGHGHVDFAGSSVVHLTGGVLSFVGAEMLGPRRGKYGHDGSVHPIVGHSAPMVVLGTFVLAFGWFGFNAGSTLAATDTHVAVVAVNTLLASAAGALSAYFATSHRFGQPDISMVCNGMLAGLVAVTAPCAFVSAPSAVAIGAVAGALVVKSALVVEHKLRIDDPVGAISVHGVSGIWGVVALGLFADGSYGHGLNGVQGGVRGVFYGDFGQLVAGGIAIAANVLYVGTLAAATFWLLDRLVGNRVSAEQEELGLDLAELGMEGYASDSVDEHAPVREPSGIVPAASRNAAYARPRSASLTSLRMAPSPLPREPPG